MARARVIKPGFFTNDELAEVPPLGRLLFAGLWTLADRRGRLKDRPKQIKANVLPYDECDVDALLDDLDRHGFVRRYEADGQRCIQVVAFQSHQKPHAREAESALPPPPELGNDCPKHDLGGAKAMTSRAVTGNRYTLTGTTPPTPPVRPIRPVPKPSTSSSGPDRSNATPTPNGAPSTYLPLLNGAYPAIAADFAKVDPELSAAWLRKALAGAEIRAGPLPPERLVAGLEMAILRIERAVAASSPEHPIRHLRGLASAVVAEALEEQGDAG